ncbi:hypothetical protein [Mucisphaera calidilacus]|uniref:Uncharacterized protein n=1 Tax=Mucisphaera calidilacus TaxID=2527982 RepID=A0A518BWN5_9BACT|nr:hypothetical protein [Mucisphaera calidilacus]QDU71389.1 hypothetical protein Pan265_12380 [Mucisphaera calidilacus]
MFEHVTLTMILPLLVLGYLLVTLALQLLTCYTHIRIARYDLIRESKIKRLEYFRSLAGRMGDDDNENDTIEIIDDDTPDDGPIPMPQPGESTQRMAA